MKTLLSGNEAIARGIYEAGIEVCSAYPGTPSTEILENAVQYKEDLYCANIENNSIRCYRFFIFCLQKINISDYLPLALG